MSCSLPFIYYSVHFPHIHSGGHPLPIDLASLPHHPPLPVHLHGQDQPYQPQHQAGPHHIKCPIPGTYPLPGAYQDNRMLYPVQTSQSGYFPADGQNIH